MKLPDAPTMTFISLQHTLKAQLHCIISSHLNHAALLIAELVCQRARREFFFFCLFPIAMERGEKICSSFSANWEHVGA